MKVCQIGMNVGGRQGVCGKAFDRLLPDLYKRISMGAHKGGWTIKKLLNSYSRSTFSFSPVKFDLNIEEASSRFHLSSLLTLFIVL